MVAGLPTGIPQRYTGRYAGYGVLSLRGRTPDVLLVVVLLIATGCGEHPKRQVATPLPPTVPRQEVSIVRLKNGNVLYGTVQQADAQTVTVAIPDLGQVTLARGEVETLEYAYQDEIAKAAQATLEGQQGLGNIEGQWVSQRTAGMPTYKAGDARAMLHAKSVQAEKANAASRRKFEERGAQVEIAAPARPAATAATTPTTQKAQTNEQQSELVADMAKYRGTYKPIVTVAPSRHTGDDTIRKAGYDPMDGHAYKITYTQSGPTVEQIDKSQ